MTIGGSQARIIRLSIMVGLVGLLPAITVRAAEHESAQRLVEDTTFRMLAVLRSEQERLRQDPGRIYYLVNGIVAPHFDFPRMARWVLGKHWRMASAGQRERFTEEFRTLLVRTYARALLEYGDQKVEVLPVRAVGDMTRVTVRTQVWQAGGGSPVSIDYRMYADAGVWKVYDVTIDGISLVTNYRNAFSAQIQHGGLENLIGLLAERNQELGRE